MKNVYLVQVDVTTGGDTNTVYLPYAAGLLAATAWADETVKNNYNFGGFIFMRDDVDSVVEGLEEPYLIGFSNYCWNAQYNKVLAQKVKEKYPDCITVFGGHNIPDRCDYLLERQYIDITMHCEGEYVFRDLLKAFLTGDISQIPNIIYRENGEAVRTMDAPAPKVLDFPSPYLEGWYDDIVAAHPEISFNAILETSRGCPNHCAYCDWGLLNSRTRLFPLERVIDELHWMADHKVAFIWGADANFGMFDRDVDIIKAMIAIKEETGYPERFRLNYSKTNYENVFNISKMLKDSDLDRIGATLSFQSMSPVVLENIGRKNMSFDFFMQLLAKYRAEKIKNYSELILGLPGETYQSFIDGLAKLLELGQHLVFEAFGCIILPNSQLGQPDIMKKFGIQTVDSEMVRGHCLVKANSIPEYYTIVVATDTMSREEYVRATLFSQYLKSLHGFGFVRSFAIYLYYEKGVRYQDFYEDLLTFLLADKNIALNPALERIYEKTEHISKGEDFEQVTFPRFGDFVWYDQEYIILCLVEQYDRFYDDIKPFMDRYGIDDDVYDNLLRYQKAIMRLPEEETSVVSLDYDLDDYFSNIYVNNKQELKKVNNKLFMRDTKPNSTWHDYAKYVVWYGNLGWDSYKDEIIKEIEE